MNEIEVTIDVNYDCNMSCAFCSTAPNLTSLQMSDKIAKNCSDFMRKIKENSNGRLTVVVSGGEPLLFNKLDAFLKIWGSISDEIILCTNGTLAKGEQYWKSLNSFGLRSVRLSLHGASEATSKKIFGSQYSLAAIEEAIEVVKHAGLFIDVNYVLTKANIDQLEQVFVFCSQKGVRTLRILGLARQGRAVDNWETLSLPEEHCREVVRKAQEMSLRYGVDIRFAGLSETEWCTHSDASGNCLGGKKFFHITANGDIYPCPGVKAIEHCKIGSVLDPDYEKFTCKNNSQQSPCLVLDQKQSLER